MHDLIDREELKSVLFKCSLLDDSVEEVIDSMSSVQSEKDNSKWIIRREVVPNPANSKLITRQIIECPYCMNKVKKATKYCPECGEVIIRLADEEEAHLPPDPPPDIFYEDFFGRKGGKR